MRNALLAITEELRRLKQAGGTGVVVSEASIELLRKFVRRRAESAGTRTEPQPQIQMPAAPQQVVLPTQKISVPVMRPTAAPQQKIPDVTLPEDMDKAHQWAWLREQINTNPVCQANVRTGKQLVIGHGNLDADLMFVGEAPGADEEDQGKPFVGPAGQLLERMIKGMGLSRDQVYIANILNWRPRIAGQPIDGVQIGNRAPEPDEMALCMPFLRAQIAIVKPKLIVALGLTAGRGLLGHDAFKTLGEIRGRWNHFEGRPVLVTYHPSYILRNSTNRSKRAIWEDLLKVMEKAGMPISEKQQNYFL